MSDEVSREKARLRLFTFHLIMKYHPNCYFCGKPFTWDDFPSRGVDELTEHHVDMNKLNNIPDNWEYSHRACHKAHHTQHNVNRDKASSPQANISTLSKPNSHTAIFAPHQYICMNCKQVKDKCKCITPNIVRVKVG